ncbi:MAG: hypothetical protein LBI65_02135, partial [Candidatus Symbiothrix sp.]|nr:hypothetical protein [Candidatus Symbiothrix sp.]
MNENFLKFDVQIPDINLDNMLDFGKKKEIQPQKSDKKKTECIELSLKYEYRRAFSEQKLLEAAGIELTKGHCYNFITAGNVDALSYLKLILLHQDLDYCLFSTWCMAAEDILQISNWLDAGKIKKMDAYLGEIFPNSYKTEYSMIKKIFQEKNCGRIA